MAAHFRSQPAKGADVLQGRTVGMSCILELGQLGVAEILDIDAELTPRAIRARLDQVPPDAFRSLLDVSGLQHLAGRGRLLIERAAEVAARGGYPKDLAVAMGMGMATLRRWMHDPGLPPPRGTSSAGSACSWGRPCSTIRAGRCRTRPGPRDMPTPLACVGP